jgi:hypothetical protein
MITTAIIVSLLIGSTFRSRAAMRIGGMRDEEVS